MLDYGDFSMKKLISIVIPIYNEEPGISELFKRLSASLNKIEYNFEIILVENGSSDNSIKKLLEVRKKDKRFKILQLAKNVGCDGGIFAGLAYAKGDASIIMMADLQEPPELISKFIDKWNNGYEIVYGIVKKRPGIGIVRKMEIFLFYKLVSLMSNKIIIENSSDFRLIDRKVKDVVVAMPEHNKVFRGITIWTGFSHIGIPFNRPPRFAGKSKAYFKTVFTVATNALFGFSSFPNYIQWVFLGVMTLLFIFTFVRPELNFRVLLIGIIMLNFSFIIQNEYLSRIMDEARNRPRFIVKNKFGL